MICLKFDGGLTTTDFGPHIIYMLKILLTLRSPPKSLHYTFIYVDPLGKLNVIFFVLIFNVYDDELEF